MSQEQEIVLIVDDEPGVSVLQRRRLERAGFAVRNAETAAAAMEELRRGGVRLVVLDYRLSGDMNGLEFYSAIKRAGYDLPVILVTGYSQESTVIDALRAGVRDFVCKSPDYLEYLLQAVERLFDRLRIERQLSEAQARLGAVVNSSMDAIIATDSDGRITLLNAAAERMFDYVAGDALGQSIGRLSAMLESLIAQRSVEENASQPPATIETMAMRRNGHQFAIETSLSSSDVDGKTFYTFIIRDITQRLKAAADLQIAKEAAEAANLAKTTFLANMSHELRTPMTAILGFTDLLLDDDSQIDLHEAAGIIRRNGMYLLDVINDLLDISKIEAGQLSVENILCSPRQLLKDIHTTMQMKSHAKGLPLTLELATRLPDFVYSDPTRLRQILINLVSNAIKFTEAGEVRIVARFDDDRRLLHIDVVDTGIGMNDDELAGLFRPFTQADGSLTRRFGGTGLGLTISKRLAVLLGGEINVRSQPGAGSTFQVTLPIAPRNVARPTNVLSDAATNELPDDTAQTFHPEPSTRLAPSDSPKPLAGRRILLVEDSTDNQRIISTVLAKSGAQVTVVENGQRAVDAILSAIDGEEKYDVVLMDIQMPVMDGYEATRRLRAAGFNVPIIALTAHAMKGDREKCFEAGCDDYMTKPIDVVALRAKVAEWVQRRCPAPVVLS